MERRPPYHPPAEPPRIDTGGPVERVPPPGFVDYWRDWNHLADDSDAVATGRLAPWLRAAAQNFDPMSKLRDATLRRLRFPGTSRGVTEAQAIADLAVSGRESFARFMRLHPTDDMLIAAVRPEVPGASDGDLRAAAAAILDRAYRVVWALRGGPEHRRALRDELGWIALSSEDDPPHAPVNCSCTGDHMGQLHISIDGLRQVSTCRAAIKLAAPPASAALPPIASRSLPIERPFQELITTLRDAHYDRLVLFLHGLGSRVEESEDFKHKLIQKGLERGIRYAVLSVDFPGFGYSSRLDVDELVRMQRYPHHGFVLPDGLRSYFPLLSYFRDVLAKMGNHVAGGIQHVMGGSLGGNMSLWLAEAPMFDAGIRRPPIGNVLSIASWSPGSIWESYERSRDTALEGNGTHQDTGKNGAKMRPQQRMNQAEEQGSRKEFFETMQRGEKLWGARTLDAWGYPPTRDGLLLQAELYGPAYRRTFWMCSYEQVVFSHQEPIGQRYAWPFQTIRGPLLLAGGARDTGSWGVMDIYNPLVAVSDCSPAVHGRRLLMRDTGHSISDERPAHLANEVERFFANPGWDPAATSWGENRIDLFGLTDGGAVRQFAWNPGWSWHELSRAPDGPPLTGPLTATSRGPGRIDVFGLDAARNVRRFWFQDGWRWSNLGRSSTGERFRGPLAATSWGPERIDVFGLAHGVHHQLLHLWWDGRWHWADLGTRKFHGPVTATSWGPGRIDLFGLDEQADVQHLWYDGTWHEEWIGRHFSPGNKYGNAYAGRITATSWGPNRIDVFGLDSRAQVLQLWFDGSRWNWANLGSHFPSGRTFSGPLTATSWGPNRIDVFGLDHEGKVLQLWWQSGWHWSELGAPA